jgi:hypothetical protein
LRIGDLGGQNREEGGDMSRIKRDFSEKMLSSHHYFEALEQRSAGAMVNGWDVFFQAFFQYASTPVLRYRDVYKP